MKQTRNWKVFLNWLFRPFKLLKKNNKQICHFFAATSNNLATARTELSSTKSDVEDLTKKLNGKINKSLF